MRVGIDVTHLLWTYRTGVQNYYHGLIESLPAAARNHLNLEFVLVDGDRTEAKAFPFRLDHRLKFRRASMPWLIPTFRDLNEDHFLRRQMHSWNYRIDKYSSRKARKRVEQLFDGIDAFHVWFWNVMPAPRAKNVMTVTDLIALRLPDLHPPDFVEATQRGLEFARDHADRVIAISEFTKQDLITSGVAAEKIRVVYCGVNATFRKIENLSETQNVCETYGIKDRPYVLSVGFLDPRKNVKGHIAAFERIASRPQFSDLQLVLVGPEGPLTNAVLADVKSSVVRDRIHVTGYVPDSHLVHLLNGARVFVYCSFYEGFGLPAVEAMACGTPVVTSNTTSLLEIGQGAALLVDPADSDQIADAIERVLLENSLRDELVRAGLARARQYTWERAAEQHIAVWRECTALP